MARARRALTAAETRYARIDKDMHAREFMVSSTVGKQSLKLISQTSFCNRKQASSQGSCRSSTNAVLATELRFAKVEDTIIFFKLSSGWCKPDFCVKVNPFFPLRYELIVDDGIILKGLIVVVRDPYARRMSSNYARDILEQMLQWKELGMLCIGPLSHRTLTLR